MKTFIPKTIVSPADAILVRRIRALSCPMAPVPSGARARVRPLAGIKAVLFDVYGTMLMAVPGEIGSGLEPSARCFQDTLNAVGFPFADKRAAVWGTAVLARLIKQGQARRRLQGVHHPEINIEDVWRELAEVWRKKYGVHRRWGRRRIRRLAVEFECRVDPVWPMPDLGTTLMCLEKCGLHLGIVSNSQFYTPLTLAAFPEIGWERGRFDPALCLWSYRLGEAKPSTRLLAVALRRLRQNFGITPPQTLVVGNDMLNDIVPATRLGCRTALFAGDARSLRRRSESSACANARPTLVLTGMRQLADALTAR